MRFSLNLPCLFGQDSFDTALQAARLAGFDTVETWKIADDEVMPLRQAMQKNNIRLAAFCPDFFILNDPACRETYKASLEKALTKAKTLHCPALITQVGNETAAPRAEQHRAIVDGLREMVPLLQKAGVTLLVEPLNSVKDHKGYYLTDSSEGFGIIREVNDPHVRLLYDIYHQLHMGEDVQARILGNLPLIGHFHVAGFPGRDEKIFEKFDYGKLFDAMQAAGVRVPLGLELRPASAQAREEMLGQIHRWTT